ncbi:MAG: ABC transporter permease, partial [Haloechinothrix sp.]
LGYTIPFARIPVELDQFLEGGDAPGAELLRLRLRWETNGGASTYPGTTGYLYVSSDLPPCGAATGGFGFFRNPGDPFFSTGPENVWLSCRQRGEGATVRIDGQFPILVAAIDPVEEDRLVALNDAIVSGRPLDETDGLVPARWGPGVPVIVSTRSYVDQDLVIDVERLPTVEPAAVADLFGADWEARRAALNRRLSALEGPVVGSVRVSSASMYDRLLSDFNGTTPAVLWSASHVSYEDAGQGVLMAEPVSLDVDEAWETGSVFHEGGYWPAPPGSDDVQYRSISFARCRTAGGGNCQATFTPVVGRFEPARLPGFSPLSQVPLETYFPPEADPADEASRAALGGGVLRPTMNLGGYIAQPPLLLTTMKGMEGLVDPKFFRDQNAEAPISAIRVRVAEITGPDLLSRERLRRVAQEIVEETGLAVDVTAGSSPAPLTVWLPAGSYGRPPLLLTEGWAKKGVAFAIVQALDRKSLLLFVLVLVVSGLFLANGSFASVRSRRRELGVLRTLGWSRWAVFRAVLAELVLVGAIAGVVGTGLAALLVRDLELQLALTQTLLVLPVAVALTALAGLVPAWRASRGTPLDAVLP